ncbi:DNA recombination protein RmuC [Limibacterium fermenti]|uniref:DNA recombination protein RmuC n=1 Tax=Limibacterium fermenti TaxID=3229863 RepID=UPI003A653F62
MEIVYLLAGIVAGGIVAWILATLLQRGKTVSKATFEELQSDLGILKTEIGIEKEKNRAANERLLVREGESRQLAETNNALTVALASAEAKLDASGVQLKTLSDDLSRMKDELKDKTDELNGAMRKVSEITAHNTSLIEKLDTQKSEMENLRKQFNIEFENIANKILEEKTQKFTDLNKNNLDSILKPLGDNIEIFKKRVDEVYDKESKERFSLGREVTKLVELNQKISEEANNLTNALKGSSKTQGDWGQMILENILEKSGLVRDREYFVQEFLKDDDGNNYRNETGGKMQPDVIIAYPDNRKVIIDSKVSLTAYTRYVSADDAAEQKTACQEHLRSIRKHIDELSAKHYQDFAPTLDFVMMFVPNEPAYLLALQHDPELWQYAYNKHILLISPTNLIAALKLIVDLWKREYQNRNALEIAERGAALYDKFAGFVENMQAIGKSIDKTQENYAIAFKQLAGGRGNLLVQAERLRELGVKSKKKLPSSLLNDAPEEDDV